MAGVYGLSGFWFYFRLQPEGDVVRYSLFAVRKKLKSVKAASPMVLFLFLLLTNNEQRATSNVAFDSTVELDQHRPCV